MLRGMAEQGVYTQDFLDRYAFQPRLYSLKAYVVGDVARNLWILLGAVGVVLLIAAANVANLFLVRIEGRRRELAVRAALGASRGAMARHFLAESLVLSLAGGVLALLLGTWGVRWLVSLAPVSFPRLDEVRLDASVLAFSGAISLMVAVVLTAIAALRRRDLAGIGTLGDGGRTATPGRERQRVRSTLVITQVALALVLIVGAGLLFESFRRLRAVNPGIDPEGVLAMELNLPSARYGSQQERWQFYRAALEGIGAIPGVEAAGFSTALPFTDGYGCTSQGFEDREVSGRIESLDQTMCAGQEPTSPGYFEALGIPLLRGRVFTDADNDNPSTSAVVVSQAFADRFWPGEDPIGKGVAPNGWNDRGFYRVVGVVGDVYPASVQDEPAIVIYYPIVPDSGGFASPAARLAVGTSLANPLSVSLAIQRVIAELDPLIPVANIEEMHAIVDRSMSRLSFTLVLLGLAASVALALAAIGLYGVISYVVARRTNEIGVRIALGARPWRVEGLVIIGSLRLVLLGMVAGVVGALGVTRVLQGLLYGVEPTHPAAYAGAAAVLAGVAALASWMPARRAASIDPSEALRVE
jgi:predicted permease